MPLLWFILHHVEDSLATGVQHRGAKADSAPSSGCTLLVQVLPLLPKYRNLTHPILKKCILFLKSPNSLQKTIQTSEPPLPEPCPHISPGTVLTSLERSSLELQELSGEGYCGMAPMLVPTSPAPSACQQQLNQPSKRDPSFPSTISRALEGTQSIFSHNDLRSGH